LVVVRIEELVKRFGNVTAVDNVSLIIRDGEFFTLLGPSGCGKTTLLRCIAGFWRQDNGHIWFNDEKIDDIPAHKRGTGMVFQNYAVFPHLNVHDNIAYGLKARKLGNAEIKERVRKALDLVRLSELDRRMPSQLSGGQQQRIALARALVIEPRVLLMDEPLSNLDAKLRVEMRSDIRKLQNELKITTIYVTHDQEEALTISDRLAVMHNGKVQQIDNPIGIYQNPKNRYVAGFIGQTNFIEGSIRSFNKPSSTAIVDVGNAQIEVPLSEPPAGKHVVLAVRPEKLKIVEGQESTLGQNELAGKIENVSFLGSVAEYQIRPAGGDTLVLVRIHEPKPDRLKKQGDSVKLRFEKEGILVYTDAQE
jgi:iron(III) transport system ATP-binding protein